MQAELSQFKGRIQPVIDCLNWKTDQLVELLATVESHRKTLLNQLTASKQLEEQQLNKSI